MLTATHIQYYHVCHRKVWLFAHHIYMEHESELVLEGALIHEDTYKKRQGKYSEMELVGGRIDFWDRKNKVVHEVKKSKKMEQAHIAQVKYYLYLLVNYGIEGASGVLEYPKLRRKQTVPWEEGDYEKVQSWVDEINKIIVGKCPPVIHKTFCQNCAHYNFCYTK